MGDIIRFRDFEPKYRPCTAYPVTQPATIYVLPVVRIERFDKPLPKSVAARMRRLRDLKK